MVFKRIRRVEGSAYQQEKPVSSERRTETHEAQHDDKELLRYFLDGNFGFCEEPCREIVLRT